MHRCLIDASRMLVVWLISIISKWEQFKAQQAIGYFFVLLGNLIYYEVKIKIKIKIIKLPFDESINEHLSLNKNVDDLHLTKHEDISSLGKENNIQATSLKVISFNENTKKNFSFLSKLFFFFFKKKTPSQDKNTDICNLEIDNQASNNSDEKEKLKEKKNSS
jgi:hypothetical protein